MGVTDTSTEHEVLGRAQGDVRLDGYVIPVGTKNGFTLFAADPASPSTCFCIVSLLQRSSFESPMAIACGPSRDSDSARQEIRDRRRGLAH